MSFIPLWIFVVSKVFFTPNALRKRSVTVLSAPVGLNCPDQPHLGQLPPPPHPGHAFCTRGSGPGTQSFLELCCRCACLWLCSLLFLNCCSNFLDWSWLWLTTLPLPDDCWTPDAGVGTCCSYHSCSVHPVWEWATKPCWSCCCTVCAVVTFRAQHCCFFGAALLFLCSSWEYGLGCVLRCGYACVCRPETLHRTDAVPCHCQHVEKVKPYLHQLI